MAFCNSCGANLDPAAKFCNKCGLPVAGAAAASIPASTISTAPTPTYMAPATPQGSSALKIVLIIIAAVVALGLLGLASAGFVAWRIAKHSHVHQDGNSVSVDTPFGKVESTQDPQEAARNLGVDVYPGAQVRKNGTASASFGGIHTVSASFDTSDTVDQVAAFYKNKFPNAMVTSSDPGRCTIVSNDHKNMLTINIEGSGGTTKIQIANITRN